MGIMERPAVKALEDGGKYWEHEYEKFYLKAYVPANEIKGQVHNYTFRAPLLLVFEEHRQKQEEAIAFAKGSGLAQIAAGVDASVLFVYPTNPGGWAEATESLYTDLMAEVKMDPNFEDGIAPVTNFFTQEFLGHFIKGAKFRTDIYSFGASADYVAKYLLKTLQGEYLWGPGEITPAMCSMQNLSVIPKPERKDIAILSVGNSEEVNAAFAVCENLLIKEKADYMKDFNTFVCKFKMWCGQLQLEPDFEELKMVEEPGSVVVQTSKDHQGLYKEEPSHEIGYFAYYNKGLLDNGPVPMLVGFHGGGDSVMFLTFVSGWYEVANRYGFLYVAIENHQNVTATEAAEVIAHLKEKYPVDENRVYATGFSMGSGKTWDMFQEYPELFAAVAPASALFPVTNNFLGQSHGDRMNMDVPVPMFYTGGVESPVPELPCQSPTTIERLQYLAKVNRLKVSFDIDFEQKEQWANPIWGVSGDRKEVFHDDERDSDLTVWYFDSTDGVCRTALGSVSGQGHELRHHTCEQAWKFMSQFTRSAE